MKRILLMVLRNLFTVPFMWIKLCWYAGHAENYTDEQHNRLMKTITRRANKGGNVTVKAYGLENLPEEDGYILYPNHQGMYDMLALIDVCPRPLSVVAKKEVENVQFLKQVFTCLKAFLIDRDDPKQGLKVITGVTEEVRKGRNYVIFAEGTRSKNGNHPGEFKGGSFKAATRAKCPIIPVALIDAFQPFDINSIAPVTVQVHILPPMYYEEYQKMKTVEIAAEVKRRIEKRIEALQ